MIGAVHRTVPIIIVIRILLLICLVVCILVAVLCGENSACWVIM